MIQKLSPNQGSRDGNPIKYICIHIMDGTLTGTDAHFADPYSQVSANYGVGLNGEIHQYVSDDKMAWANGGVKNPTARIVKENSAVNQNKISLSIECEGNDLANAPESQLTILISLIKELAIKYSISLDREHIIGHREITTNKPNCPSSTNLPLDKMVQRCQGGNVAKQLIQEIEERVSKLKSII